VTLGRGLAAGLGTLGTQSRTAYDDLPRAAVLVADLDVGDAMVVARPAESGRHDLVADAAQGIEGVEVGDATGAADGVLGGLRRLRERCAPPVVGERPEIATDGRVEDLAGSPLVEAAERVP
jgi:hypothetical protein